MSDLCPQITVRRIGWTGVYAEAGRAGRWTPFRLLSRITPPDKCCATCGAPLRRGWLRYGDGAARYHCGAHVRVEDER